MFLQGFSFLFDFSFLIFRCFCLWGGRGALKQITDIHMRGQDVGRCRGDSADICEVADVANGCALVPTRGGGGGGVALIISSISVAIAALRRLFLSRSDVSSIYCFLSILIVQTTFGGLTWKLF